jgi:hypothetical protein
MTEMRLGGLVGEKTGDALTSHLKFDASQTGSTDSHNVHLRCTLSRRCCRHLPPPHLQDKNQCIDLARPTVDITTAPDNSTIPRASIITHTLPSHRCSMMLKLIVVNAVHATPLHLMTRYPQQLIQMIATRGRIAPSVAIVRSGRPRFKISLQ